MFKIDFMAGLSEINQDSGLIVRILGVIDECNVVRTHSAQINIDMDVDSFARPFGRRVEIGS